MIELVIHGRGGRGGVTLAKLIAGAYYRRGLHVQAFGIYGAERTGAPVEAYVRVDEREIDVYGAIATPDHVIIVDPSLVAPAAAAGERPGGWIVINAAHPPETFARVFPGRRVATVGANAIAVAHGLGTRTVPIVNTALFGAVARVLDLRWADVEGALDDAGLGGANVEAARDAYAQVAVADEPGEIASPAADEPHPYLSFLDDRVGARPSTHTGTWASRRPYTHELRPPCGASCPAGNDVRGFVQAAADGDEERALTILFETSPLPGTCGRVCPAPCMAACNRRELDDAVDVRDIERALADRATWPRPRRLSGGAPVVVSGAPVAVVGSGPAGLSAAYHLARLGHPVTLVEAAPALGGLLRYGIPEYRLPRPVLEREIESILGHGVEAWTGRRVDRDGLRLLARDHAAVLVATGLQSLRVLDLAAARSGLVEQGLDFLARAHAGVGDLRGAAVVVAGGGNTAVDAARTAARLGAREVRVVYRRTRAEMPAIAEEVDEALEEGVVLEELLTPLELCDRGGRPGLVCRRMRLGEPDESGRPRPKAVEGDDALVEVACDHLLLAVGQEGDLSLLPGPVAHLGGPAFVAGAPAPVCVCGDLAGGEGTVAAAVGSGRLAALTVHARLGDRRHEADEADGAAATSGDRGIAKAEVARTADAPLAGPEVVRLRAFARVPREHVSLLPPARRRHSFAEVRRGFSPLAGHDPLRAEAGRCLSCGACSGCDLCVAFCPEGVLRRAKDRSPEADYDYCKGCGLCAAACPRGVLSTAAI